MTDIEQIQKMAQHMAASILMRQIGTKEGAERLYKELTELPDDAIDNMSRLSGIPEHQIALSRAHLTIRTKTDTHSHQVTCSSRIQNRQSFASPPPRRDLLSLGRRQSEYPSGPLLPLSIQYLQLIEAL